MVILKHSFTSLSLEYFSSRESEELDVIKSVLQWMLKDFNLILLMVSTA